MQSQVLHQLDLIPSNKKHDFRLDTDMSNILVRHVDQFVVSSAVEPTLLNFIIVPTPHSLLTDGDTDAVIANWGGLTVFSWNENGSRTDAYDRLLVAIIKQTRNLLGLNRNTTEISNQW